MSRIVYLSLSYVPSRRASSVQVMRMCEAFADAGHDVALVAKRSTDAITDDPFAFYGVARNFALELVARPRWRGGGAVYAGGLAARLLRERRQIDLAYSRDLVGAAIASALGIPTAFEIHGIYDRAWQRALLRRTMGHASFRGLVAISNAMVRELAAADLLPRSAPVVVAHSPANAIAGAAPRAMPGSPPRIGYVGSLYPGRGVELVVALAARMPGARFDIVGGSDADLARWRDAGAPPNVTFRGFVAPASLPALYRELDVLLMPYPHAGVRGPSNRLDTARYCSPMKMFEYMASGVPIVSSDLPVLQEVLAHEANALIAPADDVAAWQAAIDRLLADRTLRVALASRALADLAAFTPQARAARILRELGFATSAPASRDFAIPLDRRD